MTKIKINWEASNSGTINVNLEDLGYSLEEWEDLTKEEQLDILQEVIDEDDECFSYGYVKNFKLIND